MKKLSIIIILMSIPSFSYTYGDWSTPERPPYYESYGTFNPEYQNYNDGGEAYENKKYKEDRYNPPRYQDRTDTIMNTYREHGQQENVATSQENMSTEARRHNKALTEHKELETQRYRQEVEERYKQVEEKEGAQTYLEPQETREDQSSNYF